MPRSRRFRPLLEELEQRLVLSTVLATSTADLRADLANPSDTTIQLAAGTYNTEADAGGTFVVNRDVTLEAAPGASAATVLLDGNNTDRVFDVTGRITVEFDNVTIQHGNAGPGDGGGIYSTGGSIIQLNNSIVTNNAAGTNGGGIGIAGLSGGSGNIGSLTLTSSVVENNTSANDGGAGAGIYSFNAAVTLNQSSVHDNTSSGGGGGIAIGPDVSTLLTLNQSTIDHNTSLFGNGGGVLLNNANLTMTASTISRNTGGFNGGGIDVEKSQPSTPTLSITNSTISDNTTNPSGGGTGGGINIGTAAVFHLTNVTITGNSATAGDGIFAGADTSAHTLLNTIVAGNTAINSESYDLFGTYTSEGHNLIGIFDSSAATGFTNDVNNDQVGSTQNPINPLLGPLTNNGGPTPTNALLTGSPAIDAGQDGVVATDQRGVSRPQGAHTDIGAYELIVGVQGLSGVATITGNEFTPLTNVPVATFTIPGGAVAPGTINATINWGDNTATTTGVITQSGSTFTVSGSHTYAEHATYTITTTVSVAGASAAANSSASMDEELLPGQNTAGPLDQRLIAEFYRDILGKSVDSLGLRVWTSALDNITNSLAMTYMEDGLGFSLSYGLAFFQAAQQVAQAIAFVGGFQAPATDPLTVLQDNYQTLLDRPLDGIGQAAYLPLLQMGVSDQVVVSLIAANGAYLNKVV